MRIKIKSPQGYKFSGYGYEEVAEALGFVYDHAKDKGDDEALKFLHKAIVQERTIQANTPANMPYFRGPVTTALREFIPLLAADKWVNGPELWWGLAAIQDDDDFLHYCDALLSVMWS